MLSLAGLCYLLYRLEAADGFIAHKRRIGMIEIPDGVHRIGSYSIRRSGEAWAFAEREKSAIESHWAHRLAQNPKFFNGRVHIMLSGGLSQGHLSGTVAETDFASSLFWRETGFRDPDVADCFGAAIFSCADNSLVFGRQSPGNINSGLVYPPSGFLDPRDIDESGMADLDGSIAREAAEETGCHWADMPREPGYLAVRDGPYLCVGIVYRIPVPGREFAAQILQRLATDTDAELESLAVLDRRGDIEAHAMTTFARKIALALLPD